ncbi:metal-dependent hydrolase [Methylophilales bacterium MBRSG12]|uniref:Transport permease protein n=1 Tax=Methylophilales bacterium MBRS-H7 TaxID=1623450 RepID=A0A0H4JAW5_9PROT|nr:metal-dependent hydrolase [Methylophilales bacterium MBRSF5]AKO65647.1 metal-dependent hydrolase [Methylophilales bacterium MBRS-H7]AKO66969.1 metal-dependent hydrolase [Methylophilales bacterium MBRSG12]
MINWKIQLKGTWTLLKKELMRFWRVVFQTVAAPVITGILYLLIFSHVLDSRTEVYEGVPYSAFLIPGLIMMSLLQNAFANSSSSLVQSKVMGNIVFILLTPLTYIQFFIAFLIASIVRGLFVGLTIYLLAIIYIDLPLMHPWFIISFSILGGALLGTFGILAGIWADRFDQMAAFQNFVIMPLSFLSGVFYSIHSLPPVWQSISKFNPFFYMIDGFRYGFFGQSDISPFISMGIVLTFFIILASLSIRLLKTGYKLRG